MTLRILVVDDDEKSRRLAADVLAHHGYRVTRAASGEEAIELARGGAMQDLVLLDIQLPGLDGVATLRVLRGLRDWQAMPVIAVTASVMPHERSELMRAGFSGFLAKPLAIKDLARLVRDTLAARKG
ncbi:MAG: response regulator [Proteobacteria bacterium]|nr:response regulator [Pseudomonadota bacterium]